MMVIETRFFLQILIFYRPIVLTKIVIMTEPFFCPRSVKLYTAGKISIAVLVVIIKLQ